MSWKLERQGEVAWISFPHLEVPHGSSTRLGGLSQGPYASLNLGRHSGDELDVVVEETETCIVMEYVRGVSLSALLGASVRLKQPVPVAAEAA